MVRFHKSIALPGSADPLEATVALLNSYRDDDYYAYEHGDTWYIGLRSHASLVVDPDGRAVTRFDQHGGQQTYPANEPLGDIARAFAAEHSTRGKMFGQVGFNYSAHISGQAYIPGRWPMLSLMTPCIHAAISRSRVTVTGDVEDEARAVFDLIGAHLIQVATSPAPSWWYPAINLQADSEDYKARVTRAIADIQDGKYTKAIASRIIRLPSRVDMLATLLRGRRANTPARAFTLSHRGVQATGFSPEIVLSIDNQTAYTDALAGTWLSDGADVATISKKLLNDPKEVMEHAIAVQGSIRRLRRLCLPESIAVRDFMTTIPRGNVHHIFSRITGQLSLCKTGWDSIRSNITVPGLPTQANMDAIRSFEPYPRDLYCGVVLMLDGAEFFEATLVLRTVFQDQNRRWLQAGAGITALSDPEREFMETCEKLGSIAPYVVAEGVKQQE
ncbi:chorismate binding enzyme [Hirsutella rhossiliensis]|uniref:Chorismate binding enzyme domain-containing protein n=1 Tax=Hirsutella rhossiliensis TaxID=111463 RepID=A0A9P8SE89_9HYPO|nr:chorismate binding enzyme domain-containing protein [Hirsutella rhossiliensis]KAH0958145.1 chorismate binding enzyme domain-containing protein [Hirsutella rhossiliensis]